MHKGYNSRPSRTAALSVSTGMNFRQLCDGILSLQKDIRFVCIAILEGRIVAAQYRENVTPLLSKEQMNLWIMQALIRMSSRMTLEDSIGRPLFSLTEYERVVKSTVLIHDDINKFGLGNQFVVLLSIDRSAENAGSIITKSVISYIQGLLDAKKRNERN